MVGTTQHVWRENLANSFVRVDTESFHLPLSKLTAEAGYTARPKPLVDGPDVFAHVECAGVRRSVDEEEVVSGCEVSHSMSTVS